MEFIATHDAEADRFIDYFLAQTGCDEMDSVMRIGAMAAIHPVGQRMLKVCAERGIRVELIT